MILYDAIVEVGWYLGLCMPTPVKWGRRSPVNWMFNIPNTELSAAAYFQGKKQSGCYRLVMMSCQLSEQTNYDDHCVGRKKKPLVWRMPKSIAYKSKCLQLGIPRIYVMIMKELHAASASITSALFFQSLVLKIWGSCAYYFFIQHVESSGCSWLPGRALQLKFLNILIR